MNSISSIGAHSGIRGLSGTGLHPRETASTFAQDIMRRVGDLPPIKPISGTVPVNPKAVDAVSGTDETQDADAIAAQANAAQKKADQGKKLESSLADTISYITDKYGDAAGTAMMGLIYKRIGNGPVTEESLGQGLLDVAKFVDQHYGTGDGDALISKLNGSLNESLNAFFDNGKNEEFYATTVMVPKGTTSQNANVPQPDDSDGSIAADGIIKMLQSYQGVRDANGLKKPRKTPGFPGAPYGDMTDFTPTTGVMVDAAA